MTAANRADPRHFYTSQAIPQTFMGLSQESGPSGYGARLSAIPVMAITAKIKADVATPQVVGDLPPNFMILPTLYRHNVNTAGTMKLALGARTPDAEKVLVAALDLTAVTTAGSALTGFDGAYVLTQSRQLYATITDGVAGEVIKFTITGLIMPNGWY